MKRIWVAGILAVSIFLAGCSVNETSVRDKKLVVVGIGPMKEWVQTIAGDTVDVEVMIPPGNSPANYEPTTKQLLMLEEMERYFAMGVGAETEGFLNRIFPDPSSKVVRLYQEVSDELPDRIMDDHVHEGEALEEADDHIGRDPHIWLSIPRAVLMVERIAEELMLVNPEYADDYRKRADSYIQQLGNLDAELQAGFAKAGQKSFLLFHPSLGYFADEYGLTMMVIEEGGKSATPTHLIEVIDQAKDVGIKTVFYQEEFDENQARTIAQELGGDLVSLSILEESYLEGMKQIGDALMKSME